MKALFIVNPAAGGKDRVRAVTEAVKKVCRGGGGLFVIKSTKGPGHAKALSEEAVRRNFSVVFACGGDGTVNEVAAPLLSRPVVLGIVPLGRGNTLSRSLKIPLSVEDSVRLIKKWNVRSVDAGVFCDRYFFAMAGFGIEAGFLKKYKKLFFTGRPKEFLSRHPGAFKEFLKYNEEELHITVDNAFIKVKSLTLTVANTAYYGGAAVIAPGASPFDGHIHLCVLPALSVLKVPDVSQKLFNGTIAELKGYRHVKGKRIDIPRAHITDAYVDGEHFEWIGDITVRVLQKKLKVLTP
ncbi:MAG: diacylglycerol kinase family lipid kinase [Thermodesulfobacteriota bacterium]|nr:MAG: diacylglycerol kinase family lipid kinase [Thermodesulfobacteriota bacterium]